nr:MAG TPA: TERF1-interacting nuclear factor 2, TRF2, shelterin complex, PROTEIN BINDING [Caudoviricetes sp.]
MNTPFMIFCIGTSILSLALSASAALVMWALHFV